MAYNDIIDRTGAASLIPQQIADEIFNGVVEESAVLRMGRRLPNMTAKQMTLPVLNSLPYAYFVNGDTGLKQTTKVDWTGKNIVAEEIAVIVPVPEAVLADSKFDMWAQITPLVRQAFGQKIDAAILYGTDAPASWPAGIVNGASAAYNVVTFNPAAGYGSIMGANGLIAAVEQDGYMVNGFMGSMQARAALRGIVDANGQPIFRPGMTDATTYMLDGQRILFPRNGGIDADTSMLIAGDWSQLVYSIRQDITVKRLTEAVITDNTGAVVYNLPQQDMVALRFVMRLGWQLPNPVNGINGAASRYPFAVLQPSTGDTVISAATYNVTAPVKGAAPASSHESGTGYTAAITWSPTAATFAGSTAYTASVVYTAADGYAFDDGFAAKDITGLPATTGSGHAAQTVTVTRDSNTQITVAVKYVATAA